jgi:PDDEXK-like domain of unknown function (DUF3799)
MTHEIRTLAPGEKISENGFYSIPLSVHHSQCCTAPSVTSGILRTMELASPLDVWSFHVLNPDRWERKETDALRLGVAMAAYVEGGAENVLKGFRIHPDDKPRRPTKAQIAAVAAGGGTETAVTSVTYWAAVDASPEDYLTMEEFTMICTMGAVLARDEAASAVMGGIPELTMAWQDEVTGLWVLSRPDTVSFDGIVTDYKRVAASGKPFNTHMVDRRIEQHGYDMQIALACEAMERLTGVWPTGGIIAQQAEAPHHVILRGIGDEELRIAQWRNRRALNRFAECLESGRWPGPGEHVGNYFLRKELRERLLNEMQTEGTSP